MGNGNHVREGFIRQRRNLMALSFVLFFLVYGGVGIPKINVLGNEVTFDDTERFIHVLFILWGYFYYRYYVYFRDLKDDGYSSSVLSLLQEYIQSEILKVARKTSDNITSNVNIYHSYSDHWMGRVALERDAKGVGKETKDIIIKGLSFHKRKIKAHAVTFVHTRYFTEYGLPFLVGLMPLVALTINAFFD